MKCWIIFPRQQARDTCVHTCGEMLSVPKKHEMGCACSCGSGRLMGKGSKAAPFLLQEDTGIFCMEMWNEACQLWQCSLIDRSLQCSYPISKQHLSFLVFIYFFPLKSDTNKKHCPQLSSKVTSWQCSLRSTPTAHTLNRDIHFSKVKESFVWVCSGLQAFGRESNRKQDRDYSNVHQISASSLAQCLCAT